MKAALRATRRRLTTRLAETAEHVHVVLTVPSATSFTQEGPRVGGFIGGAINTLAVVGRTKRVWSKARRSGVARRAGIVAATVDCRGHRRQGKARPVLEDDVQAPTPGLSGA